MMPRNHFSHVTHWVFDLDNTLYAPEARLFDQIEARMTTFIAAELRLTEAEATRLRQRYWREHGTTLAGLMAEHGMLPDTFLADVHDIDLAALRPDPALRAAIAALPGTAIVHTNGSRRHAERVLEARGLGDVFSAYYGVEDAGYHPKPARIAFETVHQRAGVAADAAAMFEDDPRNLHAPHALGMRTVLVGGTDEGAHIHHRTDDLADFLSRLA